MLTNFTSVTELYNTHHQILNRFKYFFKKFKYTYE